MPTTLGSKKATRCTACGKGEPEVEFYDLPSERRCKPCRRKKGKEMYLRPEVKLRVREATARYISRNPKRVKLLMFTRKKKFKERQIVEYTENPGKPRFCSVCKIEKTRKDFYPSGNVGRCKSCWLIKLSIERTSPKAMSRARERARGKYAREMIAGNVQYILKVRLSSRIRTALRRESIHKAGCTLKLVGCSMDDFKLHLEKKFTTGMTWTNMGEWHLDHIIPCDVFDLTDVRQQQACFHFTNLRPLWGAENIRKSNKIIV